MCAAVKFYRSLIQAMQSLSKEREGVCVVRTFLAITTPIVVAIAPSLLPHLTQPCLSRAIEKASERTGKKDAN